MSDPLSNLPATPAGQPTQTARPATQPTTAGQPTAAATRPVQSPNAQQSGESTAAAAKNEAKSVAQDAGENTKAVAATAKDEVQQVAGEAKNHAQDLFHLARAEVSDQAATQQQRAAGLLRSVSGELGQMGNSAETGMASGLVNQAASSVDQIAGWLENREPADLLDDIKRYARRNPGTFLAGAALVGFLGGRVTRSLQAQSSDDTPVRRAYAGQARPLATHEVGTTHVQSVAPAYGGGQTPTTPVTTTAAGTPGTVANPQRHTAAPTTPLTGTAQPGSAERRG